MNNENPTGKDTPLSCIIEDGQLVIRIGVDVVAFIVNDHQSACPAASNKDGFVIKDPNGFAEDVVRELNSEREDGSSILTDLLDKAIESAKNNGSASQEECEHAANPCPKCGYEKF